MNAKDSETFAMKKSYKYCIGNLSEFEYLKGPVVKAELTLSRTYNKLWLKTFLLSRSQGFPFYTESIQCLILNVPDPDTFF